MRKVCVAAIALTCATAFQSTTADKPDVRAAADMKWTDNPSIKGARQAVLWGDPTRESYGALKRVPAGTVLASHWHTNLTRFVVLAGSLDFAVKGTTPRTLGPQAYGSIPRGIEHSATCQPGADCVYFETSTGPYDVKTR